VTTDEDDVTFDPDVEAALARGRDRPWPGPDLYTLRGMVELDLALDTDVTVDAAHAVLSDGLTRAFGPRWYDWLTEALSAEGRNPDDVRLLLTDDALGERVLTALHRRMGEDDQAPEPPEPPEPPDGDYGWYAYPPDDPHGGRAAFRRAAKRRAATARAALLAPRRRRVAGRRDR
jgi:hypothetical protein